MRVAVVIVGFRNADDVEACLQALDRTTYENFEVVICENGGSEAYQALRQRTPCQLRRGQAVTRIEAPSNLGYAGGVNLCIRQAEGADAWWILNPDTEPDPAALEALVERLGRGDCDAVGGTLYLQTGLVQSYGGVWRSWLGRTVSLGFGEVVGSPRPGAIEAKQNFISGASMLVSARFVQSAGLMREDFFLYCEEVEWFVRARRLGLNLGFSPEALVLHKAGGATGSHIEINSRPKMPIYLDERNKILLTRMHFPGRLPVVAAMALSLMLLRFGRRGAWRQLYYGFSGWCAGLRGERGRPSWIVP